jgi:Rho-binding antiterminator
MISCAIHDYFESACVFHYQLSVETNSGDSFIGVAKTIFIVDGNEFLQLEFEGEHININLEQIKHVVVLTKGAKFNAIEM